MINSQIPFNQLPFLRNRLDSSLSGIERTEMTCLRQLEYLNGYLDGILDEQVQEFLEILHLADFRHSLDLEREPIALHRLMEGYCSENALKDPQLQSALNYLSWYREVRSLSLDQLAPGYLRLIRKGADSNRERKEITVKSYFTNLTLYTAPQGNTVLQPLRLELDSFLKDISSQDSLTSLAIIHFHIRTLAPFNDFNGFVARAYNMLSLRLIGLNYDFIPLSWAITKRKEQYQSLIRQCISENNLEAWVRFMHEVAESAAHRLYIQLKSMLKLKRKLKDQLLKYTIYDFPEELVGVLMKQPYIKTAHLTSALGCHRHTAYTYLNHLVAMGILIEKTSGREKLYLHKELFDLIND